MTQQMILQQKEQENLMLRVVEAITPEIWYLIVTNCPEVVTWSHFQILMI